MANQLYQQRPWNLHSWRATLPRSMNV